MFGKNHQNLLEFKKKFFHKIKQRLLLKSHQVLLVHYAIDAVLFVVVVYSIFQIVSAATPNPGHPWTDIGDGVFTVTYNQTAPRVYTFPNADATVLTTNALVTVAQGGTNANSLNTKSILTSEAGTSVGSTSIGALQSIRRNAGDTAFEAYTPATAGMTYPGSGIVSSTGSAWGTSYSTSGSGTVLALTTSPVFTTPTLGAATGTTFNGLSITNNGTNTLNIAAGQTLTVTTGGTLGSAAYTASTSYAPAFTSGSANYFWATPNGTTGVPSLRAIVAADIPTLNQNTTGTAANISGGLGGQVLYQSGAGTTAKLTNGTAGQILTAGGTTVAPSWTTPPISIVNSSNLFSTGLTGTGSGVTATTNSNFFGVSAGSGATSASYSNFLGNYAGNGGTNASNSNFLGNYAGGGATSASASNFLGSYAGANATSASASNFLGNYAGGGATNASNSNFLGYYAGYNATSATNSNFLGQNAGNGATNASYSNLFGFQVGGNPGTNNIGSNNIIIGTNVSLPDATTNAMNLGGILFATGTHSDISTDPSTTASGSGKIGIGVVRPTARLEVLGKSLFLGETTPPTLRAPIVGAPTGIAITSCTELQNMDADLTETYYLANDIDCSDTVNWNSGQGFIPVGNQGNGGFTGSFDGQGHVIKNLTIHDVSTSYSGGVGLFGWTTAGSQIKNVGLTDVDITSLGTSNFYVGALVGANLGTVTSAYSTGVVSGYYYVGGLIGTNDGLDSIYNSYSTATVTGNQNVGGLTGMNVGVIENSYATGDVTSTNGYAGGLIGVEWYGTPTVTNCYSNGYVSGPSNIGGLIGYDAGGLTITNSYWDTETSGQTTSAGGTGVTTTELATEGTFTSWNFSNIWYSPINTISNKVTLSKGLVSSSGTGDNYFAGNVGLGVLAPQAKLDVLGKAYFSNTNATYPTLIVPTISAPTGTAITTCTELQNMNNDVTISYYLANDIDCSETATWNSGEGFLPVGYTYDNNTSTTYGSNFTGTFNGNGHTISNLHINRPTYYEVGLFGEINGATIENVGLVNVNIIGLRDVGGLIGWDNSGSSITNSYTTGSVTGSNWGIGGFIGWSTGSTIYRSYSEAKVEGGNANGDVGGFAGGLETGTGSTEDSYATGSVKGGDGVGGFTGYVSGNTILNSYSTGAVSGLSNVGGFTGFNDGGATVTNSYWDTETSKQSTDNYATGKTTKEMQTVATYSGWDFSTIWQMVGGDITLNHGLVSSTGAGKNFFMGNVGIGTINPLARLSILGSDNSNTNLAANISGATGTGLVVTNNNFVGIGTNTPKTLLDLRVSSPSTTAYLPTILSGTGLNDISISGTYTGATPNLLVISIDSTGSPDTFSYQDTNGDCPTVSGVNITGSPQLVCDGLSVTFAATTGHTNGNAFFFSIGAGNTALNIGDGTNEYFTVNSVVPNSNFLGSLAGIGATGAYDSNFSGTGAGYLATNAYYSNFFGSNAGSIAISANNSNFLGMNAGSGATSANNSNFFGNSAGYNAPSAINSNFLGNGAGNGATSAYNSNFFGLSAGYGAYSAWYSNFLGTDAGNGASAAVASNFIGHQSGYNATNAQSSNFIGYQSGYGASNASYSNIFGNQSGKTFSGNNIGSNNIIIGNNISLPNATADAMNLGGILFGTGTYSTISGNPSITAVSTGKIGIGVVSPTAALHIRAGSNVANGAPLKLTSGTLTTGGNISAGAVEFDGTHLYFSVDASNRYQIDQQTPRLNQITAANGTATIDSLTNAIAWNWSTASTQNPFSLSANALTSGKLLTLSSSATTSLTSAGSNIGSLLDITESGAMTAFTGNLASINASGANTVGATGNALSINIAGTAQLMKGISLTDASTGNLGVTAGTSGGALFSFTGAHTGYGLQVSDATATGTAMAISANAITTGAALLIPHTTSVIASGGSLVRLSSTSNDTSTTTGALLDLSSSASTGGTQVLQTYSALATGIGESIVTNALSSGTILNLSSNGTAALTGEKGLNISLSGANATGSQTTYGTYISNTHSGTSNNVGIYSTSTGGSNNYAAIFDQGNVGIGTTAPGAQLDVSRTNVSPNRSFANMLKLGINTDTWSTVANFNAFRFIDSAVTTATDGSPKSFQVGAGGVAIGYANTPVYGSSDALYVSGNVGIGTTAPASLLHILKAKAGSGAESIRLLTLGLSGAAAIGDETYITFNSPGSSTETARISGISGPDNVLYGSLAFSTRNYNTDTLVEVMRMNNKGNVGIGTTSPNAKQENLSTTEQLRLSYDATHYASFTTASTGNITVGGTTGILVATGFSGPLTGTASKATNLVGGNSTTLLGSIPYQSNTDTTTLLSPNTSSTKNFFTMTGTGTNGAVPAWGTIAQADVSGLTTSSSPTFAGETLTGNLAMGANYITSTAFTTTTTGINSTNIGATTAGTGAFTTLTSSGNSTIGTGSSLTNTFGSGASSINIIGSTTTPGALTLHGATTLDNTLTVSGSNLTSLGGNLTVTGTSWTATPTISGLITATSGLTSNGTLTVAANQNFVMSSGSGTATQTFTGTTTTANSIIANALSSGTILNLSSNGTAAAASQKGLNIALLGTNATSAITTYGAYLSNTHAGTTSTNVGLYATASGGTTANYAGIFDQGRVLIGSTTESTSSAPLSVTGTTAANGSSSALTGILGSYTFNPTAGGVQAGNRFVVTNSPTTTANTGVAEFIRVVDNTSLANLVRGLDVTANGGSNTAGTNTGIRAAGATFGVQASITGLAGGVSVPAALYGENTGTTQGDVLRLFSNTMTSATSFANFYQDTSTFTGTGLLMKFATGSGTFSGNFIDLQKNNTSVFKVTNAGVTSMGLSGTASTTALCSSLANGTAPTAGTAYEIRDCSGAPVADYAEMYPVDKGVQYGDIVTTGGEIVNTYDVGADGNIDWTKVKGNVSRLIKSTKMYQDNVIGIVSDNHNDFSSTGYNIKDTDNPMPVALNGRVPVKISNGSPSIKVGDYITTSEDTGKATKATMSGYVIGKALEDWNPTSGKTTIMIFVEQGYYQSDSINEFTGETTFNGLTYFNASVDFAKSIVFNDTVEFTVPPLFNSDTAGFAVIKAGSNKVDVVFDKAYITQPVVTANITLEDNGNNMTDEQVSSFFGEDIKSVVINKTQSKFTIEINKIATSDIKFSWIALAVKNPKIFESVVSGLIINTATAPFPVPISPSPTSTSTPTPEIIPTPMTTPSTTSSTPATDTSTTPTSTPTQTPTPTPEIIPTPTTTPSTTSSTPATDTSTTPTSTPTQTPTPTPEIIPTPTI